MWLPLPKSEEQATEMKHWTRSQNGANFTGSSEPEVKVGEGSGGMFGTYSCRLLP